MLNKIDFLCNKTVTGCFYAVKYAIDMDRTTDDLSYPLSQ